VYLIGYISGDLKTFLFCIQSTHLKTLSHGKYDITLRRVLTDRVVKCSKEVFSSFKILYFLSCYKSLHFGRRKTETNQRSKKKS